MFLVLFSLLLVLSLIVQACIFSARFAGYSSSMLLQNDKLSDYSQLGFCFGLSGLTVLLAGAEVFLCVFTIVIVVIALLDHVFFAAKRDKDKECNEIVSFCREYAVILLTIFLFRNFVGQQWQVPTGSLEPTVRPGDFVFINQFAYGWHLPIVNTKIYSYSNPKRGDIAVVRNPVSFYGTPFVKRVVGVPGDHVVYKNKRLTINGELMQQDYLGADEESLKNSTDLGLSRRREFLQGRVHDILVRDGDYSYPKDYVDVVVPEKSYFLMGDNRDNSNDSRFWGSVSEDYLVGKGEMVLVGWDFSKGFFGWPNFSRSGMWL